MSDSYFLKYQATPTLSLFHHSEAFVRGVKGPIGSGKSVGCCMEIFKRASQQLPGMDGVRRSRWAIVRNTGPELETTTLKTWLDWFPESKFGKLNRKPPITHHCRVMDIDLEVIFLALDRPDDVKKLLSLELTGCWFNEAKFIHKDIVDAATGRVGRYPSKKNKPEDVPNNQWPTWYGVIMDTNPPDDDHWWYEAAEEVNGAINGWEFFDQPSGLSKEAENLENLPVGYYDKLIAGKDKEWIKVYAEGKYGTIKDGKPVYSSYNDNTHCGELTAIPFKQIEIGQDFGNTPAAVICQENSLGQIFALEELVAEDMALTTFAQLLKKKLSSDYPNCPYRIFGDPSGGFKDQHQKTAFDIFRAEGLLVRPAPTNKIKPRLEAVNQALNHMVNGRPKLMIDKKKCSILRKGFNGGYKYKRMQVSGTDRFTDEPDKNRFSHPHDALQYVVCAVGGYTALMNGENNQHPKTRIAKNNWKVW